MSVQFAKLFETESYGQILAVSRDHEETEEPVIRFTYNSLAADVMVEFSVEFEEGYYEARDKAFNSLSEEQVIETIAWIEESLDALI